MVFVYQPHVYYSLNLLSTASVTASVDCGFCPVGPQARRCFFSVCESIHALACDQRLTI